MSFIWYSRQRAQVFITRRNFCTWQQLKLDDVSLFQPLRTSQPRSVIIKLQEICCIFKSVLSWWSQGRRSVQFGPSLCSVCFWRSAGFVQHWTTRHPSEVVLNAELWECYLMSCGIIGNFLLSVQCHGKKKMYAFHTAWRRQRITENVKFHVNIGKISVPTAFTSKTFLR